MAAVGALGGERRLLEREAEIRVIRAALASAAGGDGRLVLLEGAPGTGKTAMLRAARDLAAEAGCGVLAARGSPLETEYPFGVVRQLLEAHLTGPDDPLLSGAAAPARTLLLPGGGEAAHGPEPAFALLHALYWLLVALAGRRPLLVAIDDAHWADPASLTFLRFLAGRLDDTPVALVVATRPAEAGAADASLLQLELDPLVDVLRPAPLSHDATRQLVTEALGEADDAFVAACREATGGNPFFLAELVRALVDEGVAPTALHADEVAAVGPARVGRWVLGRLAALPPEATRLARAVAVLGDDADMRIAAAIAELDADAGAAAAGALIRAAVLEDAHSLRFTHPIVRAAVYRDMPEPERAHAHGRAARLLTMDPRRADAAAAHHLRSDARSDPAVVDLLTDAAARALARGTAPTAIALLARALEEPPAPEQTFDVLLALGRAHMHAGALAEAEPRLREAVDAARDDGEHAAAVAALARSVVFQARFEEGHALLDETLATLEGAPAMELEAVGLELSVSYDVPTLLARLERYADLPGATETERTLLIMLGTAQTVTGDRDRGMPLVRRALGDGSMCGARTVRAEAWIGGVSVLMGSDDLTEVGALVERGIDDARRHGAVLELAVAHIMAGVRCRLLGALGRAEVHVRTALEAMGDAPWRFGAEAHLAGILTLRGEWEEAEAWIADTRTAGPTDNFGAFLRVANRGRLRLLQGRVREAVEDLSEALELEQGFGQLGRGQFGARYLLAAALAGSDRDRALALARADLELSVRDGVHGPIGVSLWSLGVAEGGEAGVAHLREAVAHLARSQLRLHHAEALASLGAALRRGGLRREAREHLREALDIATRCGAEPLVKSVTDELRATGARPRSRVLRGPDALTPMERRIADMAAQGLSNREIAEALFVTRKNVEMHLSRAYGKLGIRSREELADALSDPQS